MLDLFDQEKFNVVSLEAELGPRNACHISRRFVRRTPPLVPHRHEFYEVFWITTGCCSHYINGRTEGLSPGHVVFIRPDDTHAFQNRSDPPCQMVNVAFARTTADFLQARYGCEIGARFFWSEESHPTTYQLDQPGLDHLMRLEENLSRGVWSLARIESFLLRLVTDFIAMDHDVPDASPRWLSNACQAMRKPEALREGVPLLVRTTGRSHEHVSRSFRRYLGQTPSSWINSQRMALSARMLVGGDDPILDIALACGINDLSNFYRLFKQIHGISPKRYRDRHRVDLVHPLLSPDLASADDAQ